MTNEEIFDKEFEELEKEDLVASLDVKPFRGWIISLMEKARASGLPSKSRDEAIAEFIQELGSHGISIDLNKLKEFQEAAINLFEAGRQSSLAEIIGLKEQLDLKDERIEELKAQFAQKDKEINDLNILILNERSENREQVRKLQE